MRKMENEENENHKENVVPRLYTHPYLFVIDANKEGRERER